MSFRDSKSFPFQPDAPRQISDSDAEVIACHIVDKLVTRLSDEATVNGLMSVWTKQFDQHVGRSIRRGAWVIMSAIVFLVAVRFEAVMAWFRR
jgi:hypothetical protein